MYAYLSVREAYQISPVIALVLKVSAMTATGSSVRRIVDTIFLLLTTDVTTSGIAIFTPSSVNATCTQNCGILISATNKPSPC